MTDTIFIVGAGIFLTAIAGGVGYAIYKFIKDLKKKVNVKR